MTAFTRIITDEESKILDCGLRRSRVIASILHAIESLEYHDANHLSGDNKSRSENKMELLNELLDEIPVVAGRTVPTVEGAAEFAKWMREGAES